MNGKLLLRIVTIVPVVIDGIKFVVDKIKLRRKRKLTDEERVQAMKDASAELDKILEAARKAQGK